MIKYLGSKRTLVPEIRRVVVGRVAAATPGAARPLRGERSQDPPGERAGFTVAVRCGARDVPGLADVVDGVPEWLRVVEGVRVRDGLRDLQAREPVDELLDDGLDPAPARLGDIVRDHAGIGIEGEQALAEVEGRLGRAAELVLEPIVTS